MLPTVMERRLSGRVRRVQRAVMFQQKIDQRGRPDGGRPVKRELATLVPDPARGAVLDEFPSDLDVALGHCKVKGRLAKGEREQGVGIGDEPVRCRLRVVPSTQLLFTAGTQPCETYS